MRELTRNLSDRSLWDFDQIWQPSSPANLGRGWSPGAKIGHFRFLYVKSMGARLRGTLSKFQCPIWIKMCM